MPMDFSGREVDTARGSMPQDRSWRWWADATPRSLVRRVMGVCARLPMVSMPSRSRMAPVLPPTPQRAPTGRPCRNSTAASLGMRRRPSGLACEEAILATDLVAAMPTDAGRPTASRMRVRMRRAMWVGEPRRRREPATSRNASSMETCSRAGVIVARIPMTWWE